MSVTEAKVEKIGTDEATGYSSYRFGSFTFTRDEYFAHILSLIHI